MQLQRKWFFVSKWWEEVRDDDGNKTGNLREHSRTYRKLIVPGVIKGKKIRRYLKRCKVADMKRDGHLRGNNTPYNWVNPLI